MTVFAKVFARDLEGEYERELMLNLDRVVKIEPTDRDDNGASASISLHFAIEVQIGPRAEYDRLIEA